MKISDFGSPEVLYQKQRHCGMEKVSLRIVRLYEAKSGASQLKRDYITYGVTTPQP